MTAKEILSDIIQNFDPESFKTFFRLKNTDFAPVSQPLNHYQDKQFTDFYQIGEINFHEASQRLVVIAIKILIPLSERSGKKAQYEKAKKILKELNIFDSGILIFYDQSKNFRFSLIYANYLGKKRDWSTFRRFTYFVSREFTNKTFSQRIGDGNFSTLEDIKGAFSVEPVNKEFYRNVALFFNELAGGEVQVGPRVEKHKRRLILPSVAENAKTTYQEFTVRLIGRIIFCWFLKHKKSSNGPSLISDDLLSSRTAKITSNYYHSILEKLFFEILRKPIEERRDRILEGSENIPFLNGGLFEPHEEDFYEGKPAFNLVIPDKWFIEFLGMLEQYNFTIDENTAVDVDISVDPEMLGKIFENLLAEINPETGQTARKSTGSYYTPREIVDYMADESLKQYLTSKVNLSEEKVQQLLSYDIQEADFSGKEINAIIDALHEMKVLDPACGSGAFPMGILHKMLLILQKIDPQSEKWFAKKIEEMEDAIFKQHMKDEFKSRNWDYVHKLGIIQNSIFGVDIQSVAVEISKLRFFLSLIVDEIVDDNAPNRGIKPLPSLEFKFVCANSLIGLPPRQNEQMLFNIEDVASIKKLKKLRDEYFVSYGKKKKRIETEFLAIQKEMRQFYLKQISRKAQKNLFGEELKAKDREAPSVTKMLAQWNPFVDEPCDWFDPEWMFGVRGGFDIVIANPPYVRADSADFKQEREAIMKSDQYETLYERWDLFVPFIEKGLKLLGGNGLLCYITSNSLCTSKFAFKILEYIQANYYTRFVDYFDDAWVFEAGVVPLVFGVSYEKTKEPVVKTSHFGSFGNISNREEIQIDDFKKMGKDAFRQVSQQLKFKIKTLVLGDICYLSYGLRPNSDERFWRGEFTRDDLVSETRDATHPMPYIEGKNLGRYRIDKVLYLEWGTKRVPKKLVRPTFPELYKMQKLLCGTMTGGTYDNTGVICNHSIVVFVRFVDLRGVENKSISGSLKKFTTLPRGELEKISKEFDLKYLLAISNSYLAQIFLNSIRRHRLENYFYPDDYRKLPIAHISLKEQKPFVEIVDKILSVTQADDYLNNISKQAKVKEYERQIDQMVYELYGLTKEEIKILENFK